MNAENIAQELNHQLGNYGFELDATTLEALVFLLEEVAPEGRERVADFFHALGGSAYLVAESVRFGEENEDQ